MSNSPLTGSLREEPRMAAIFKAAESRFLTEQELDEYHKVFPQHFDRVSAARDVAAYEHAVVQAVVDEIFLIYPYAQQHQLANAKCTRDVRYVVAYATLSMLMNDADWFRDKLLVWMKTILQAFEFPDGSATQRKKVLFVETQQPKLKPHQKSIFDTYYKLKRAYQRVLIPSSHKLMDPYFQIAIDILSGD